MPFGLKYNDIKEKNRLKSANKKISQSPILCALRDLGAADRTWIAQIDFFKISQIVLNGYFAWLYGKLQEFDYAVFSCFFAALKTK